MKIKFDNITAKTAKYCALIFTVLLLIGLIFSFLEIPGTEVFYIMAVYTAVLVGLPCYVVVLAAKLYFARLRAYGYEIPDNKKIYGEEQITKSAKKIKYIEYSQKIKVNPKVIEAVNSAELIIFSSGYLLTSIAPHLINKTLAKAIRASKAPKMYICNLFTQPGETDNYSVSNHLKTLESYLGKHGIDVVIANNNMLNKDLVNIYQTQEQKDPVIIDTDNIKKLGVKIISDNLAKEEDGCYRHDSLKTAYLIFSYLMNN